MPDIYAPLVLGLAFAVQSIVVFFHWKLAREFGWITSLVCSAIAMTTMMTPRIITMLYSEGLWSINLDSINSINSTIYLFDSSLFLVAILTLHSTVTRGRESIITRIAAQEKLRKLEDDISRMSVGFMDYWQMAESLVDGIVMIDSDGTILYVNESLCKLLGFSRTQLTSHPLTAIMPQRYRRRHLESFREYLDTGRKHTSWQALAVSCCKADGSEIAVEISFSEFLTDGHRRFVGIIRFA